MFYYVSKIAWFFLQPSNVLIALAAAGALLMLAGRLRRLAGWCIGLAVAGLLVCGFSPLGHWLILPLEERFPQWSEAEGPPDGVILLGGSFDTVTSLGRGVVTLNESAERVTAFAELARRFPDAKLVFTGGSGHMLFADARESDMAGRLFEDLGVAPGRILLEPESRNTWQNAVLTRDLVQPKEGERWLVITSAWHLPRAIGCFRAAGFDVEAYPADFRSRGWQDRWRFFGSASEGLRRVDVAIREWIGLVAYRLTGRTSELLPGP